MDFQFVSQFLLENLIKVTTSRDGNNFTARCPFCGDSKKSESKRRFHLKYINEDSQIFNCFNCFKSGTFYDLYAYIKGITEKEAYIELNKFSSNKIKRKLKQEKKLEQKEELKEEKISDFTFILSDCIGVKTKTVGIRDKQLQKILKKFKEDRKIDSPLFIAYRGLWKDRIIIPIIENRRIVYFQGRTIYDNVLPKYLNPSCEKEHIIFQREKFDLSKFIIVTEGLLDASSIGNQGTACLGASLSEIFIKKLLGISNRIIIALDNDEAGISKLKVFLEETKHQFKFFLMPERYGHIKDLNELKIKEEVEDLYDFIVKNSYSRLSVQVKLRTEKWRNFSMK